LCLCGAYDLALVTLNVGSQPAPAEAPELAAAVSDACVEMGLIVGELRPGIREGNTLRLAP